MTTGEIAAQLYMVGLAAFIWWMCRDPKGGEPAKPE